jgi:hypothetical protein
MKAILPSIGQVADLALPGFSSLVKSAGNLLQERDPEQYLCRDFIEHQRDEFVEQLATLPIATLAKPLMQQVVDRYDRFLK